jgi:hypothetical protein
MPQDACHYALWCEMFWEMAGIEEDKEFLKGFIHGPMLTLEQRVGKKCLDEPAGQKDGRPRRHNTILPAEKTSVLCIGMLIYVIG